MMRPWLAAVGMAAVQAITAVLRIHSHCPGSRYCQGCPNVHPCPTRVLLIAHSSQIRFEEKHS